MSNIIRLTGTKSSYESLFGDIFFEYNNKKAASIKLMDPEYGQRFLTINYSGHEKYRLPSGQVENAFVVEPIVFTWRLKNRQFKGRVTVSSRDGSLEFHGATEVYPVWFSSPSIYEGINIPQMYSELSLNNESGKIIKSVRSIFPYILDLSLESIAGGINYMCLTRRVES